MPKTKSFFGFFFCLVIVLIILTVFGGIFHIQSVYESLLSVNKTAAVVFGTINSFYYVTALIVGLCVLFCLARSALNSTALSKMFLISLLFGNVLIGFLALFSPLSFVHALIVVVSAILCIVGIIYLPLSEKVKKIFPVAQRKVRVLDVILFLLLIILSAVAICVPAAVVELSHLNPNITRPLAVDEYSLKTATFTNLDGFIIEEVGKDHVLNLINEDLEMYFTLGSDRATSSDDRTFDTNYRIIKQDVIEEEDVNYVHYATFNGTTASGHYYRLKEVLIEDKYIRGLALVFDKSSSKFVLILYLAPVELVDELGANKMKLIESVKFS